MIAAIINFCTNDYRFLARSIAETKSFSSQIIVPVCDHFFDGTPENRSLLQTIYQQHPDVLFLEFAYLPRLYTPYIVRSPTDEDWTPLWHSTARYLSYFYADADYLLFLDADEIIEGEKFSRWLQSIDPECIAFWFSAYQYGFSASERLSFHQQTALLVKKNAFGPLQIYSAQERFGLFASLPGPKKLQITDENGTPMIHHYSWVRPRNENLLKSRTWGKKHQEDWTSWLDRKFEETETVIPYFDPLQIEEPKVLPTSQVFANVTRVNDKILHARELDQL